MAKIMQLHISNYTEVSFDPSCLTLALKFLTIHLSLIVSLRLPCVDTFNLYSK